MNSIKLSFQFVLVTAMLVSAVFGTAARGVDRPNPDFTKGGQSDEFHDWTLGPTGLRGWIYGRKGHTADARQILVTKVAKNSPADGILKKGDVIMGVAGRPFDDDARIQFAQAITAAEQKKNGGVMSRRSRRIEYDFQDILIQAISGIRMNLFFPILRRSLWGMR